jgi:hypothetical protein
MNRRRLLQSRNPQPPQRDRAVRRQRDRCRRLHPRHPRHGLSAKPIANTEVFCVAYPNQKAIPRGAIHPKRILQQVVAGVRDYGNRMGIPTVNGAVYFDDRYIGNPLVFCGCVGLIPRDKVTKQVKAATRSCSWADARRDGSTARRLSPD